MRTASLATTFVVVISYFTDSATADILYRGDGRRPWTIRDGTPSGFKARGYNRIGETDQATEKDVKAHVSKNYEGKSPMTDRFISTTTDIDMAKEHALANDKRGCVYYLDREKITEKIMDVASVYKDKPSETGYAREKEWSVFKFIPWAAVTQIECHDPKTKTWRKTPLDVEDPTKKTTEAGSSSKTGKGKEALGKGQQEPATAGPSNQQSGDSSSTTQPKSKEPAPAGSANQQSGDSSKSSTDLESKKPAKDDPSKQQPVDSGSSTKPESKKPATAGSPNQQPEDSSSSSTKPKPGKPAQAGSANQQPGGSSTTNPGSKKPAKADPPKNLPWNFGGGKSAPKQKGGPAKQDNKGTAAKGGKKHARDFGLDESASE